MWEKSSLVGYIRNFWIIHKLHNESEQLQTNKVITGFVTDSKITELP